MLPEPPSRSDGRVYEARIAFLFSCGDSFSLCSLEPFVRKRHPPLRSLIAFDGETLYEQVQVTGIPPKDFPDTSFFTMLSLPLVYFLKNCSETSARMTHSVLILQVMQLEYEDLSPLIRVSLYFQE